MHQKAKNKRKVKKAVAEFIYILFVIYSLNYRLKIYLQIDKPFLISFI